jgi:hypothetical protein
MSAVIATGARIIPRAKKDLGPKGKMNGRGKNRTAERGKNRQL